MVYPVGETAKLPDLVKNIREEDVPERFVPNCAVSRKANKNIDEGADATKIRPFVINIFR